MLELLALNHEVILAGTQRGLRPWMPDFTTAWKINSYPNSVLQSAELRAWYKKYASTAIVTKANTSKANNTREDTGTGAQIHAIIDKRNWQTTHISLTDVCNYSNNNQLIIRRSNPCMNSTIYDRWGNNTQKVTLRYYGQRGSQSTQKRHAMLDLFNLNRNRRKQNCNL